MSASKIENGERTEITKKIETENEQEAGEGRVVEGGAEEVMGQY